MSELVRNSWYWLALIGLLAGTLSGTLGIGGGVLLVPALVLLLGADQKVAQGISLAAMIPMVTMGAVRYYINPNIKIDGYAVLLLVPFAVVGANVGAHLATVLPAATLKRVFGIFVIITGIRMLWTRS